MDLIFGIPAKRESQVKEDLFPNDAVLTVHEAPEVKGGARRFSLNKNAVDMLEVTEKKNYSVSFAVNKDGVLFLANVADVEVEDSFKLTHQKTFSNKRAYMYVIQRYNVESNKAFHILLHKEESLENGMVICKLGDLVTLTDSNKDPLAEEVDRPTSPYEISADTVEEEDRQPVEVDGGSSYSDF